MLAILQFRELIVKPVLQMLVMDSPEAEELLVFTCATESRGGTFLKQLNGPALGIYQMEPDTHNDIWHNYIMMKQGLNLIMGMNFAHTIPNEHRMIYDLHYATAMARLHYARVKEQLPNKDDVNAIWNYYKKYYNTSSGNADRTKAIGAYLAFLVNSRPHN